MSAGFLSNRCFVNWQFYPHGVLSTGVLSATGGFFQ